MTKGASTANYTWSTARRTAAFTGNETVDWAGHKSYPYFSVAGNMLAGGQVIEAMAEAYQANLDQTFANGCPVLEAGQAAGGDKRGRHLRRSRS